MAKYCTQCGTKLDEKTGLCPNCGVVNSPNKRRSSHTVLKICFIVLLFLAAFLIYKTLAPLRNGITQKSEIGDMISFGSYEQDNHTFNGKEPIEWIILEKDDDHALLISAYCIDCRPYNNENVEVIWENSSLRKWLNNDFMDEAFSSTEKKKIISSTIDNPGLYVGVDTDGSWIVANSDEHVESIIYQAEGSDATEDNVYLLNADEVTQYLDSGVISQSSMTKYAKERFIEATLGIAHANGYDDDEAIKERYNELEKEYGNGCCYWWLRSSGTSGDLASVASYGSEGIQSQNVMEAAAVRPVICVKIN